MTILASSLTLANADYTWRVDAICRDTDPELFFPVGTTGYALLQIARAKEVCGQCPVQGECLDYALETNQDSGHLGRHVRRRAPRPSPPVRRSPKSRRLTYGRSASRRQIGTVRSTTVPAPFG